MFCLDNDPRIIDGMRGLLERWGCQVVAGTALEVLLEKAGDRRPDIALVDYHLDAGSNGINAVAALRAAYGEGLPACLVTADRSAELMRTAGNLNIDMLNKPVKPAALRAILGALRPARGLAAE